MIRLIAYISLTVGIILAIANLTMSHSLAGGGQYLSALTAKREWIGQTISSLTQDIAAAQSLSTVSEKARALGLSSPVAQRALSPSILALHP